jgi:hypothetical protein
MRVFSLVVLILVFVVAAKTKTQFWNKIDFGSFIPLAVAGKAKSISAEKNTFQSPSQEASKLQDDNSITSVAYGSYAGDFWYSPSYQMQPNTPGLVGYNSYNCCSDPCCSDFACALPACQEDCCCDDPCYPNGGFYEFIPSLLYRGGSGRGYRNGYGTLALFLAQYDCCSKSYPFVDLRCHRIADGGRDAANVGLGFRKFSCDWGQMVGANVYYDYRSFRHGHFHQAGLGLELLGPCWDVRANGYLPFGKKRSLTSTSVYDYPGGYVVIANEYHIGLWGVDFEVGKTLFCNRIANVYAAAGPYFYGRTSIGNVIGGMGRVEAAFSRYLTARLYVTYDQLFKTKVQGEVMLSLPLCCHRCWECLFMRVERNEIIVTDRNCCYETNY